ncbi:MAG TPA: O-antigen ligase family protein [Opitutaceae bacterium]|nr:O-antigen ligase family protein [Opitutaceae bacterium]
MDPASSSPDYVARQKPLEHFRANTKRLKIHPQEVALLWIVCGNLCLLPWAIGGMRPWSQIGSFVLALAGFVVALVPRNYSEDQTGSNRFRLVMWPKLFRFPLFWLGLALLGYVTIQGLNPAWEYRSDGKVWWMRKTQYIEWLPSGVDVPFSRWGPWRMLLIYASVWLVVCSMWVGFTRRRTLQFFFLAIAGNGLLLAVFGLVQRLVSNGKMFWFWDSPSGSFFSSFVYKNHAGSFLDLTLFVSAGLAAWYYLRGLRRLEKSNPSGVLAFFATCIAVAILVSYARGATLVMLAFLCVCIAVFVIHQLRSGTEHRRPIVAIVLILIFGYFLKTGLEALHSSEAWTKLKQGVTNEDASLESRRIATRASLEMLRDYWRLGAGSGSFEFLFPAYQQHYPEIFMPGGHRLLWEHAHNDLVEIPAELGLPGMLLIFAGAAYLLLLLTRNYFWTNPVSGCIVLGLSLLLGSAWWDFTFQNPAILTLSCALLVAATMWTLLEELSLKG